jgi:hypothetical protein
MNGADLYEHDPRTSNGLVRAYHAKTNAWVWLAVLVAGAISFGASITFLVSAF